MYSSVSGSARPRVPIKIPAADVGALLGQYAKDLSLESRAFRPISGRIQLQCEVDVTIAPQREGSYEVTLTLSWWQRVKLIRSSVMPGLFRCNVPPNAAMLPFLRRVVSDIIGSARLGPA